MRNDALFGWEYRGRSRDLVAVIASALLTCSLARPRQTNFGHAYTDHDRRVLNQCHEGSSWALGKGKHGARGVRMKRTKPAATRSSGRGKEGGRAPNSWWRNLEEVR